MYVICLHLFAWVLVSAVAAGMVAAGSVMVVVGSGSGTRGTYKYYEWHI